MTPIFPFRRAALPAALSIVAACALAGCSQNEAPQNPPPVVVNPAPPPASTTVATTPGGVVSTSSTPATNNTNAGAGGATGADSPIADAVNKAIHSNTQMTGSRVTAVVDASGTARLTGTAQNQQQKALAETTARQTSGVTSVANKIEIVPTGGTKSASSKPAAVKTKIIVVHDQAPAPSPSGADTGTPAPDTTTGSTTTTGGGTPTTTTTPPGSTP